MLSFQRPVSIDIGSHSVKVAQIIERRGTIRAIRFAEQELPLGFRWEIGGDRTPLVAAIRAALAKAGISTRAAVMAIPRRQVTARISAFPPADRAELRRVLELDLADHIPFPVDQVVVDFQTLGPCRDQPGLIEVQIVAAPQELVREYLRLAEDLGLRVAALSVDALALHDLVQLVDVEPAGLTVALEIGARATTINVSEANRLRLTRSVGVGSRQLARAIQEDLGLDPEEAEGLRRVEGLNLLRRQPGTSRTAAWLDNLRGEIRRSAASFGPGVVSRIMLAGGGSAIPGLREALAAEFGAQPIDLSAAEVFRGSELSGADWATADRCLLAIAGGLRAVGRSAWTVSLLPREVLQFQRARRVRRAALLGTVAVSVAISVGYLLAARRIAGLKAEVRKWDKQVVIAEGRRARAQALLAERERLRDQLDPLGAVRARRYIALELLRSVALYAPDEVVLTNFTLRRDQPLEIRGTAPTSSTVADLQHVIGLSPMVTQVQLTSVDRMSPRGQAEETVSFTMRVQLWTEREAARTASTLSPWGVSR